MFFDNWYSLFRILIVGMLSYFALILMLRTSSNRTLSQMNAFDFTVSVAVGSVLATVILDANISLAEGLTAFLLLLGLQFVVSWLSMKFSSVNKLIKSEPHLLFYHGQFVDKALKKTRIQKDDIYQAARSEGLDSMDSVAAVVLEPNGSLSIVEAADTAAAEALKPVQQS